MKLFEIIEIEKDNNIKKHIPYGYYLNYDQAKKIMRELNLKIKKNLIEIKNFEKEKQKIIQNDIIDNIVVSKQLDKLIKNYIFSYSLINSKICYYIKKINI